MRVVVNREACFGYGSCAQLLPDVFSLDHEGKSVAGSADGVDERMLRMAAWSCPRRAIQLLDEAGNELPNENG